MAASVITRPVSSDEWLSPVEPKARSQICFRIWQCAKAPLTYAAPGAVASRHRQLNGETQWQKSGFTQLWIFSSTTGALNMHTVAFFIQMKVDRFNNKWEAPCSCLSWSLPRPLCLLAVTVHCSLRTMIPLIHSMQINSPDLEHSA